jgi:hypothetical protein
MSAISVEMFEAGKVNRPGGGRQRDVGHVVFRAGNHDGSVSPRLDRLIELLDPIDAGQVTTNLWGERWGKLCLNCMGNPVAGISAMGSADLASSTSIWPRRRQASASPSGSMWSISPSTRPRSGRRWKSATTTPRPTA